MDDMTEIKTEDVFIDLTTDSGTMKCKVITAFDFEDGNYIALLPFEEETSDDKEGEIFIYGYRVQDDEEIELYDIEDENEWNCVLERFDELMKEE